MPRQQISTTASCPDTGSFSRLNLRPPSPGAGCPLQVTMLLALGFCPDSPQGFSEEQSSVPDSESAQNSGAE
eukprot:13224396-Alexandrium_andersonii.AAC.1